MIIRHLNKWLSATMLIVVSVCSIQIVQAQSSKLEGVWTLDLVQIDPASEREDIGLTAETCLWRDLYGTTEQLAFEQGSRVRFLIDGIDPQATYALEGNTMTLFFVSPNGQSSFIQYEYSLEGNQLKLFRTDPLVQERYQFIRLL